MEFLRSLLCKEGTKPRKSNRPVLPQPRLQLGGGLVADGPADLLTVPEKQQRRDGVDLAGHGQLQVLVGVQLAEFHGGGRGGRCLQYRAHQLAGAAPVGPEIHHDGHGALQNLGVKILFKFVAIVGPSGSGKSTLLHLIGGVDRPDGGHVYVDGNDVYARNDTQLAIFRRREVGLIYQFYNLIPVLNVVENVTLPVLMDGRKVDEERLEELLTVLHLKGRENHLPNQLSGGQQQRVSIGRALMNDPALLLADEPTGNLDSANSHEIMELLKLSNKKYNQTLVVITHDENIALQADRIIEISDGRITRDEVIR